MQSVKFTCRQRDELLVDALFEISQGILDATVLIISQLDSVHLMYVCRAKKGKKGRKEREKGK